MSKFIPNSFQVPNAFVDEMLAKMSGNASKCYLIIARKTRGWQKEMDRISRSQFMRLAGLSKPTIIKACDELIELNILKSEEIGQDIFYELDESNIFTSKESLPVNNFDRSGKESLLVTSKEFLPTKTNIKTTNKNNIKKINKNGLDLSAFTQQPSEQVWSDFVEHRKNKKAKLTQTALNLLIKQINACLPLGYTTDDVLAECMARGWVSVKVDWLQNTGNFQRGNAANSNKSLASSMRDDTSWIHDMGNVL
jgi:phage replication O-like protein O